MKPIIPGRDPGVTGHAGGWIMYDEQPRPRGSIGSLCAEPEHRIGADPMQLELWSALQPGHRARRRDHVSDGLTYRGDCGPRSTQGLRSQSDPRLNQRADDGAGATSESLTAVA